jgi:hypothetical protein
VGTRVEAGFGSLKIVWPGPTTKEHENRDGVPKLFWRCPPPTSMADLMLVAGCLATAPPFLPTQTRSPKVTTVPAPISAYVRWAMYPIILALVITLGVMLLRYFVAEKRDEGGVVFIAVIFAWLTGIPITMLLGLNRFRTIKRGLSTFAGRLDRTWETPDGPYIRVDGMPFVVGNSR